MKRFLIIGNGNAVTYKEIFPLIKDNKLWLGVTHSGCGSMWFRIPDDANDHNGQKIENGIRMQTIGSSAWYTNIDHSKRHQPLELTKTYDPARYPRYDNYDAIEVSCIKDIPKDYDGVMGVPISIVLFSPEQFKILDARGYTIDGCEKYDRPYMDGKRMYFRTLIQRSNEMNARPVINGKETYRRVLIQNSIPQTYVNGEKKYARVFDEHSHHKPDILYGGVFNNPYINEKKKYQRILIIRVKKYESNNIL